ncbi:carbonic anhydrase [Bacteroidetes bacterium endosymbiont of Geopemphigus sp.]|uniref:carbonic anhydrase n=1 Tax=Bacteroidetes bacterium endosymbiont of Geopemphigus sp. TaxID=2047937 RepID=UPI000CD1B8C0|nr:carbonic anhydrase [Bacteroidetes bacterium endosymbiont of Geopemphigus sp.]
MKYHKNKASHDLSPKEALRFLQEGNFRFINAINRDHDHLQMINVTSENQWPFAVILSCMDSRISSELIFDQGLGDVFSIRIAGNAINYDVLGSIEYACKIADSKLIVLLGHTRCGAIKGACDEVQMENLSKLLAKIYPAVQAETSIIENRNSKNEEFVEKVCDLHLRQSVHYILQNSRVLKEMIDNGEVGIIPAKYDLSTGKVTFYEKEGIFNSKKQII